MMTLVKTMTLLLAISIAFSAQANDSSSAQDESLQQEITEGKIQASILNDAIDMQTQSAELISNIQFVQDMVGTSIEDSGGLLKALGEKEFFASMEKQKIDALIVQMQGLNSYENIADGVRRVRAHLAVIVKLNREARELVR